MKTYQVYCDEMLYYAVTEIQAENEQEAREKFLAMWDAGNVEVDDSEIRKLDVIEQA
jgi:hypothetical protein